MQSSLKQKYLMIFKLPKIGWYHWVTAWFLWVATDNVQHPENELIKDTS